MVNKLTTILGFITIIAADISVFILDKVSWWDAVGGGIFGVGLIYVKNSSLMDKTMNVLKYRTVQTEETKKDETEDIFK